MKTANTLYRGRTRLTLGCLLIGAATSWSSVALSQQPPGEDSIAAEPGQREAFDFPVDDTETHSRRDADGDFLQQVSLHPERFIGKPIWLENGKPVGTVLDVRRKLDNLFAYFIVDATVYFNSPTTYAIPVREVEGMEDDVIMMELSEGMHVKGLTYYPDDYTAVNDNFPRQAIPTGNN